MLEFSDAEALLRSGFNKLLERSKT